VNSGGVINQAGLLTNTLTANGTSTLNASGNVSLSNATNDFIGAVNVTSGTQILLTDINALTAIINSTGLATIKAGGNLMLSGTAGGLTSTTTGALSLISFGNLVVNGALNATSGYNINQNGVLTNTLTVSGASTLNAVGNVDLRNANNNFVGAVNATSGAQTLLTDINALTATLNSTGLATLKASGVLIVSGTATGGLAATTTGASSHIGFGNTTVGGALNVNSGGVINQAGLLTNTLTVNGISTLKAISTVNLSNASNNFVGAVNVTSGAQTLLTDLNALTTTFNSTGAVTLKAGGELSVTGTTAGNLSTTTVGAGATTFGNTTIGGALTVNSAGQVSQVAGGLKVTGTTILNAGLHAIMLGSATNDFVGKVTATGSSITLTDSNALNTNVNGLGLVSISAGGALTVGGTVTGQLSTTTTGLANTTVFDTTSVTGLLNVTSTGAISRLTPATVVSVVGLSTVNGVAGAVIP
jgi:hypothetical protein